jgi:hypothetical protein
VFSFCSWAFVSVISLRRYDTVVAIELTRSGLPEVDFVQLTRAAQTLEPFTVGDRDERRDFASHDESSTKRDKHLWLIDRNRKVFAIISGCPANGQRDYSALS